MGPCFYMQYFCSAGILKNYLSLSTHILSSSRSCPVCNFRCMKNHAELIDFYWNYFVMSPSLMRGNTGDLAIPFLSKSYCFFETIAQRLKNSNVGLLICLVKLRQHTLSNFAVHIKFWKKMVSKWAKSHGSQQTC